MAPDNPSERRWQTSLCGDCGELHCECSGVPTNEPEFIEVCPVSELEVALRERDEAREETERWEAGISKMAMSNADLKARAEEAEAEVAELKRRLEEKDGG